MDTILGIDLLSIIGPDRTKVAGKIKTRRGISGSGIGGATPAGIMAGISAAREGLTVAILERETHIGGLPANGLGATDIATRGVTGGLFMEFVDRIKNHYIKQYGDTSRQVKDCSNGYHFEPKVAEMVFE